MTFSHFKMVPLSLIQPVIIVIVDVQFTVDTFATLNSVKWGWQPLTMVDIKIGDTGFTWGGGGRVEGAKLTNISCVRF